MSSMQSSSRKLWIDYRAVWRWHFYAGLFVIPFIVLLSLTGSVYLFRPQIEAAIDRPYDHLPRTGASAPAWMQIEAAVAAVPGSRFAAYVVPTNANEAVRVLVQKGAERVRVYVHPEYLTVLKTVNEEARFMRVVRTIHGELLMGDGGSLLVELAACWAIVMIVTGLYLWWPRNARGLAGVLYPRLGKGRLFWRDLHAVVGLWVSFFALFLLLTALPWTNVWGAAFKQARVLTGTAVVQDWSQSRTAERAEEAAMAGATHAHHDHGGGQSADWRAAPLDAMIRAAQAEHLAPPLLLAQNDGVWRATSDAQNRTKRVDLTFNGATGAIQTRTPFAARHPIDQAVGIGTSAHEGQLFGPLNQALGVLTALGLVTLCVSAVAMWWARRPSGQLGAPASANAAIPAGAGVIIIALGLFLPVLGVSMIAIATIEFVLLRRIPGLRTWLGLAHA